MQKEISSIRRKIILSITLIVLAALCMLLLTACSVDIGEQTYRDRGFTVTVTYDYNGGTSNQKEYVEIFVKENSKLPTPKVGSGDIGIPGREGYSFKGFYLAETDDDGKVTEITDKLWDFKNDSVTNKDVVLCAQWWENYKVVLHYGTGENDKTTIDLARNTDGTPVGLYESSLKVPDYTFLSYNLVEGSTDTATALTKFPYDFSSVVSSDQLQIHVYGEALNGVYTLVRSANDLSITSVGENSNFYLLNDIDMEGAEYDDEDSAIKIPKTYNGKFVGNGHTISNFTMNMKTLDRSYDSFGLFRNIGAEAEITDVTFKNVKLINDLSDTSIGTYYLGMLAGQVSGGAVIKNVNITSDNPGGSVFGYTIGVGVDKNMLNIAEDLLIAQKPASFELSGCSATQIARLTSAGVKTKAGDDEYMIYVKYTENQEPIVFDKDSIYALAIKTSNGSYASRRISSEYLGDNKYVLTRADRSVYDVVLSVNNGELSATMVKRG